MPGLIELSIIKKREKMDLSHLAVACGIVPEDKTKDDVK